MEFDPPIVYVVDAFAFRPLMLALTPMDLL